MDFDFDPAKDLSNQEKHGIGFLEAQRLWDDPFRLIIPAKTSDEARFAVIASLEGKVWTGIFTVRAARTRIISVRRARPEERVLYEDTGI